MDRHLFAEAVTQRLEDEPLIRLVREEVEDIPAPPAVIATGPLTSDRLSQAIRARLGTENLSFFDAIAPIFSRDSIDEGVAWLGSRYGKGEAAYLNCPLDESEYEAFMDALLCADVHEGHDWENVPYFEGCLPIEVMAQRGRDTLRFGPMRPVGLHDPRTGLRHHAVAQLRAEDLRGRMWNLVGFQTKMTYGEQKRVFRMIPGLSHAEFLRYGSIHRNAYLCFPAALSAHGGLPENPGVVFAGQITGVEGYTESIASGLMAALNIDRMERGELPVLPPPTTMLGGLHRYLREASPEHFQPMNANFGLLDPLAERVRGGKRIRRAAYSARALEDMRRWAREHRPSIGTGALQ